MIPIFETKRLTLRPVTLGDAPATQRLFPHWEIVRYLGHNIPWPYPEDGALQFYRDVALPAMERGDMLLWAIRLKEGPSHLIGCIGLHPFRDNNRSFWLALPWQRHGIMQEACTAITDFWFNGLNREKLRVAKAVGNNASRRISEREGARLLVVEERNLRIGATMAEIWEITKEEWNARRRAPVSLEPSLPAWESAAALAGE